MPSSPFDLGDDSAYSHWRESKLATAPTSVGTLAVEVRDPRRLTTAERNAILERCRRANMAIYAGNSGGDPDKAIPAALGASLGLLRLDHNPGADEDAITSIRVQTDPRHLDFIPYTTRPLDWHTDGYYNPPDRQVRSVLLHCVQPALAGGENALLDHELVYLQLRDLDPDYIRALMRPDCMTIPASHVDGEQVRPSRSGPVFSIQADGQLHMRFTNRNRHIQWREDPLTAEAVDRLKEIIQQDSPWRLFGRLESGWGLVCNNVLHTRTAFTDGEKPRLVYRARYYDRIADC